MASPVRLTEKKTELTEVNGDFVFGVFVCLWIAVVVQQARNPLPTLTFEHWLYNSGMSSPSPGPDWAMANYWVPGVCTFLYVTMLLHMPEYMKNHSRPTWLKKVIFVWNIALSLSSSWALVRLLSSAVATMHEASLPPLYKNGVRTNPFHEIVCDTNARVTCATSHRNACLYLMLFCMSKIPEMLDTFWLLLAKKKVIFLHWFHHTSVMWFCWLAWAHTVPMGTIFALMNLSVHSIMYAWYALSAADRWLAVGLKPKKLFSQTVTCLQIVQMILGLALTLYVHLEEECGNPKVVTRYALGMYGVYLLLFVHFFYNAYCRTRKPRDRAAPLVSSRASGLIDKTTRDATSNRNKQAKNRVKADKPEGGTST